jgi:thioredoxin-like negative regulator of GroEL
MNSTPIAVQLVTAPGCSKCDQAKKVITDAIEQQRGAFQIEFSEVDLVERPEIAAEHDIWSTPALVINGELAFQGRVNEQELRAKLAAAGSRT